MIIVEGPDGSGKSTLVRRLSQDLRLPVAPRVVKSDTTAMVNLGEWTERNVQAGFQDIIFDRHRLVSEPIYGPILRARQDVRFMDFGWLNEITWQFYQLKPIIVYCMPEFRVVLQNVSNPNTDNATVSDPEIIEAIYASYINRAVSDSTRGIGRLYNYKTTLYSDILGWVQARLKEAHDRASSDRTLLHAAG